MSTFDEPQNEPQTVADGPQNEPQNEPQNPFRLQIWDIWFLLKRKYVYNISILTNNIYICTRNISILTIWKIFTCCPMQK